MTLENIVKIAVPLFIIGAMIKTTYEIHKEYQLYKTERDFRTYLDKLRCRGL